MNLIESDAFQAKYDAKQSQKKQTLLPFNQKSWEKKQGYHVYHHNNGIVTNGEAYKPLMNGSTISNNLINNSFVYNARSSNSNLLFVWNMCA